MKSSPTARELLRRLSPIMGVEKTNRIWRGYLAADPPGRRHLETMLAVQASRLLDDDPSKPEPGLFLPPPPERCLGDIDIGEAKYADRELYTFGLRRDEMLRHVGVFGASGTGKTVCVCKIVDGLMQGKTPFWLADFKESWRSLLVDYPDDVLVLTVGEKRGAPFAFNPLIPPPNVTWQTWAKKVVGNAVSMAFMQGAGSESLLLTALNTAYEEAALQGRWPTFQDVAQTLSTVKRSGRKGMWLDSAQRAITSITEGTAAEVFCPDHGVGLENLLQRYVVFELNHLGPAEASFFAQVLLLWLIHYRMANTREREELHHCVIIEEAQHLIGGASLRTEVEPVIHQALREVRELGESIILATQNPSLVPVPIYGNLGTQISLAVRHSNDVRATANALVLKDEAKDMLTMLPVGEAIVRVPRWKTPVHLRLFNRPMAKGAVTNDQIRESAPYRAYSTDTAALSRPPPPPPPIQPIPPGEYREAKPPESTSMEIVPNKPRIHVNAERPSTPTTTPEKINGNVLSFQQPSTLEHAMIRSIVEDAFLGVVERIKAVATSRRKGTAALAALEERGLIKGETLYTGSSLIKLFNLTQDGRAFCRQHSLGPLPHFTEGGITHRYWVYRAAEHLRAQGWHVKTEHCVSEDFIVDVHAEKDGKTLAVLVETGKSNHRLNQQKARKAGYGDIKVVPLWNNLSGNRLARLADESVVVGAPEG